MVLVLQKRPVEILLLRAVIRKQEEGFRVLGWTFTVLTALQPYTVPLHEQLAFLYLLSTCIYINVVQGERYDVARIELFFVVEKDETAKSKRGLDVVCRDMQETTYRKTM
jgi:hypothetical protein